MKKHEVAHKIFFVEIGSGNGSKFDGAKLDESSFVFLGDEGDVAEIAEQIINASDADIFVDCEHQNWRFDRLFFFEPQRRVDPFNSWLRLRVGFALPGLVRMGGVSLNDVIDAMADILVDLLFLFDHGVTVRLILIYWCNV